MASTGVMVFNLRVPRKLHEALQAQAKLHSLTFDSEVLARLTDSFHYEHWREQRARLLQQREVLEPR
jgi:hypothetical protein